MTWKVEWDDRARRELRKLDRSTQESILRYFRERITGDDDPRRFGKSLSREYKGLWRYRIGDFRAICQVEDNRLIVLVLRVGHRHKVYR